MKNDVNPLIRSFWHQKTNMMQGIKQLMQGKFLFGKKSKKAISNSNYKSYFCTCNTTYLF